MKSRTSGSPNTGRRRNFRVARFGKSAAVQDTVGGIPPGQRYNRVPGATYRLQFNANFTLNQGIEILDYLGALGVTDVYASPLFEAGPGSTHGYDTCSHARISERLGGQDSFTKFVATLRERGIGLLLDVVPNHMGASPANAWWWDVLKNGRWSKFARCFDIDWERGNGKIVLPVLGDELERVRADGQLTFAVDGNEFLLGYYKNKFPLSPRSPTGSELIDYQHYKLIHWKRGAQEINYRRFFDVSELVALRVEDRSVFDTTHRRIFELVRDGKVTGLRIDHPDGLRDPQRYFTRLQARRRPHRLYVVAEKILSDDEPLPRDWPIAGTTGYDFLNDVNGIFVSSANEGAMTKLYHEFTGCTEDFAEVTHRAKNRVIHKSFIGDVQALADKLATLAGIAPGPLCDALIDLIACFPVYRTYIREKTNELSERDSATLERAFAAARVHSPDASAELDLLEHVLFLRRKGKGWREIILRFQQLTGPAAAKGIEDTAFYQFNRLVSLNEVGGDPACFGLSVKTFHDRNKERAKHWPHSLLATSTHDTKRGEDARTRIHVLSEMPGEWRAAVFRWRDLNARFKSDKCPDENDEYLFYQTLIGTWTMEGSTNHYRARIAQYMLKAIKESKRHTSWTEPNETYERATTSFIEGVLSIENAGFLADFAALHHKVAFFGIFNSLSQTLLKLTSPGVPDIYQGTELWDFSLVDPDNRQEVDYAPRRQMLNHLRSSERPHLQAEAKDGTVKLLLTYQTLQFRNTQRRLFNFGEYIPLEVRGACADHVCAFAKTDKNNCAVVAAPRLVHTLMRGREVAPLGKTTWGDTQIVLSGLKFRRPRKWRNVLTGETASTAKLLNVHEILRTFPVALLAAV